MGRFEAWIESIAGHVCCDNWVQLLANRTLVTRGDIHMGVPKMGYTWLYGIPEQKWQFMRQMMMMHYGAKWLCCFLSWHGSPNFGTSRAPSEKWCSVCCFTSWFNHHKPAGLFFYVFLLKSNVTLGFSRDFSFRPDNTSSDASPAISDGNPM